MKFFATMLVCLALLTGIAAAQSIDGKWLSERKIERDGQSFTIKQTFDLKQDASKVTGKVTVVFGEMEPFSADVQDGKIDGKKFSFAATMSTPNGDFKTMYSGTVEGDTLKGMAARDGGQERPFEAKKQ